MTIDRPASEVPGPAASWPAPLARLADDVELRTNPAPGDRGTEVYAQRRADRTDPTLDGRIRGALRETRMILETGEILLGDAPSTTRSTVTNLPLRLALRHARTGGRL
ncbi:hypothetical protein [Sanguibacter suaedae]|uniref:Uncharacterized protein n=1 Tax=Sanguibacter suaedae TaxID=2795737 RepID=A0A934MEY5_9MICO|nr:hypothetical protein [Sanguibacter suaedae]MBI9116114.1 hypothetical protein [Sanguibacter suaedae]